MEKIPTLFVRDENDRKHVTDEVTPGCEWVLAGEGVATRKYDGTCVMFDGEAWWARREVKKDQVRPTGFKMVSFDPVTLKTMGWVPIEDSSFYKFFREAVVRWMTDPMDNRVGTYELIGPKINGNPEKVNEHILIKHELAERMGNGPETAEEIKSFLIYLGQRWGYEGLVWHHPDGRMVKLKVRDLPIIKE